jgi:hypothetical protein
MLTPDEVANMLVMFVVYLLPLLSLHTRIAVDEWYVHIPVKGQIYQVVHPHIRSLHHMLQLTSLIRKHWSPSSAC